MSNTVWLQTSTAMINTANIDMVNITYDKGKIKIVLYFTADKDGVPIAYLKSQKSAKKFISLLGNLIKTNIKCIDVQLIADQCDNETESDV